MSVEYLVAGSSPALGAISEKHHMNKKEKVNHPSHYNQGKYEVIDVICDWNLDFIEGNIIKYVARSGHKDNRVEDLKKARWYLDYLIKREQGPLTLTDKS